MIGKQIGPYAVLSKLGEGGMGEVWRATDTNLGRQVAIKVLPDLFAQDRERLARFEREAKTLAALNHPNIAIIHGLEKSDGAYALVMELVEGPTLADRIARGAIPVDEAVPIAKQIAEALEAAHEQAIVHRDLKPANIKVREDGTVKVLDFGLAKALDPAQGSGLKAQADLTNSPTLTSPAMTALGMILGTAAYMAPEQARGKPVDKRADIWAFGCVLFEMLTGRKPFEGDDVSLTLSKILQRDPDWTALPAGTPPSVRGLLDRCLDKDPKRRLRDIGEARLVLEGAFDAGDAPPTSAVPRLKLWQRPGPVAMGAAALVLMTALATWLVTRHGAVPADGVRAPEMTHLNVALPSEAPLVFIGEAALGIGQTAVALSPDARRLVYVGRAGDSTRLYVRALDAPSVRPIPGSEGAFAPFFSPDGHSIAFFARQRLMTVSADDGQPSPIAEVNTPYGGSWSDDGRIAVVMNDGARLAILGPGSNGLRIAATFTGRMRFASPVWLPNGEWLLLSCGEPRNICAVSSRTGERRHLTVNGPAAQTFDGVRLVSGSNPRFIAPGFLVYGAASDNVVMGIRFDPATLATIGEPVELLRGVRREHGGGGAYQLATTLRGDGLFAAGAHAVVGTLVWADKKGAVPVHSAFGPRTYGPFFLSEDGRRIVIKVYPDTGPSELWFFDAVTGGSQRWNDGGLRKGREPWPGTWVPGATKVLGTLVGATTTDLVEIDGERPVGGQVVLSGVAGTRISYAHAFGTDGRFLADVVVGETARYMSLIARSALLRAPSDLTRVAQPLIQSPGNQGLADLSQDGNWFAYTSDESGPYEVWAARLPIRGSPVKVSPGGCELPRWSPKNDGLYYRCGQRWFWSALTGRDDPVFAPSELFVEGDYLNISGPEYAVSPDGSRLMLLRGSGERTTTTLDMIINWRAELERRLPAQR